MPIDPIHEPPIPPASVQGQSPKRIDEEKLKRACGEFESLFFYQILKAMRQTVSTVGFSGEGSNLDVFQSFFDQELSKSFAKESRLGLGKMIYKQMVRNQQQGENDPPDLKPFHSGIGSALRRAE